MDSYNLSNGDYSALMTALGSFFIVVLLIVIAIAVLLIVAEWKVYKKAGKKGWECIIPFYSTWVLVEIAGLNWWWFLIAMAGSISSFILGTNDSLSSLFNLVTIFGGFVCHYNIAKKLHKGTGFAVLMTIFPVIMYPIIGFSKDYQFDHSVPVSKNGIF